MKRERAYRTAMRIYGGTMVVFGCGYAFGAAAEELQHYRFSIPPQNLAPALNTYSIQADQQIVYSKEMVQGRRSPGLVGEYGAEEALTKVLGTDEIVFSRTASNVLVLAEAEPAQQTPVRKTQATVPDAPAQVEQRLALEEVVVTAQKVEENLQRTPVSVATLSAEDLSQRAIVDPASLQGTLPGVQFQPIGDVLVTIRGLGTFNLQPGVDAAVAYNVDGVYLAHGTALPPLLFDLERVEALRGPQGTLFGRNANAGAINTVTRKPEHELQANAAVGVGNFDLLTTEGMLNVPLGERVALRAAFATQDRDGHIRDGHNDAQIRAGRIRLLIEPTDTLTALFTVDYAKEDDVGAGGSTPCPSNYATRGCNNGAWNAFEGNETATPNDYRRVENLGVYGELNWHLPSASLTSITSWRRVEFANLTTTGSANIPFAEFGYNPSNTDHLFTQELRLNSLAAATTKWAVGAYYSRERLENRIEKSFGGFVGIVEDLPHYRSTSKALFAQATTPVTDAVRVTAGARYTKEDKEAQGTATQFFSVPAVSVAVGGDESRSKITWKAGVEYDVAADSMLYANISTGYKSGGVNMIPPGSSLPRTYAPEKITAYQVGSKSRFLDSRLQVNAEAFYYEYRGFQELLSGTTPSYGGLLFYTVNSQRARSYGGEIEVSALLTEKDRFDLAVALLDSRFSKFDLAALGGRNFDGNEMRNAPNYTVNAGYRHTFSLPEGASLNASIDVQVVGSQFLNAANERGARQDSYTQTSASLTYEPQGARWSASVWGRNLEDETIMYTYFDDGFGGVRGWPQAPRTYGMSVRVNFE